MAKFNRVQKNVMSGNRCHKQGSTVDMQKCTRIV
jgi:hypothetical protein